MLFKRLLQKQLKMPSDYLLQLQLHTPNARTFQNSFLVCSFFVVVIGGGLGAAEAVVLCLDRGNRSIFAEQASARKLP